MDSFFVHILAEDHVLHRGQCQSMTVPLSDGLYGILAHHSNMVSAVVPGELNLVTAEGEHISAAVSNGFLKIEDNDVLLLVETAERPEEIDAARARKAAEAAREAILSKQSQLEYRTSQAMLIRAANRLKVKDHNK